MSISALSCPLRRGNEAASGQAAPDDDLTMRLRVSEFEVAFRDAHGHALWPTAEVSYESCDLVWCFDLR